MYEFLCGLVCSSLGWTSSRGIAESYNFLFHIFFLETAQLLYEVAAPFCILISCVRGLWFPHVFVNTCYCPEPHSILENS